MGLIYMTRQKPRLMYMREFPATTLCNSPCMVSCQRCFGNRRRGLAQLDGERRFPLSERATWISWNLDNPSISRRCAIASHRKGDRKVEQGKSRSASHVVSTTKARYLGMCAPDLIRGVFV